MTSSSRLQTGWMPCMAASATSAGLVVGRWPPLLPASQVTTLPPWGAGSAAHRAGGGSPFRL